MGWVWTHSKSRNGARLVLLAIADAASDDGTNAWPSIATLTRKANLSVRAVQTAVKELVLLGELKVEMNAGRNGTNRYSILMLTPAESAPPQILHPADSAGVEDGAESDIGTQDPPQNLHPAESAPPQNSTPTPAESAPKPKTNHPTTKKTSSSSTAKRGTRIPDDFAVTDDMVAWCRQECPGVDGRRETQKFVNYWMAKSGSGATKLDWPATWKNWMLTAADRIGTRASPPLKAGHVPYQNSATEDIYEGQI
jgi:hypothetical protein